MTELTALVSIAAGKAADLVVLAGNRATNIDDVERMETVSFVDSVFMTGYLRRLLSSRSDAVKKAAEHAGSESA